MHDEMQESWDLFGQPGAGGSATHPDLETQLPLFFASQLATLSSALGCRRDEEGYNRKHAHIFTFILEHAQVWLISIYLLPVLHVATLGR